jgi:hypothetical protein
MEAHPQGDGGRQERDEKWKHKVASAQGDASNYRSDGQPHAVVVVNPSGDASAAVLVP